MKWQRVFQAGALLGAVVFQFGTPDVLRSQQRARGGLRVVNASADSIRVELRDGRALSCGQNRPLTTRTIPAGRSWTIRSDAGLCYRYLPYASSATSAWSPWRHRPLASGAVVTDSL